MASTYALQRCDNFIHKVTSSKIHDIIYSKTSSDVRTTLERSCPNLSQRKTQSAQVKKALSNYLLGCYLLFVSLPPLVE